MLLKISMIIICHRGIDLQYANPHSKMHECQKSNAKLNSSCKAINSNIAKRYRRHVEQLLKRDRWQIRRGHMYIHVGSWHVVWYIYILSCNWLSKVCSVKAKW